MTHPKILKHLLVLLALALTLVPLSLALAGPAEQTGPPVVIVNTANLHQRTGPGIQYAVQGIHAGGAVLQVIARNASATWWEVSSQFGPGWVNGEFVLTRGNFTGIPVVTQFGLLGRPSALISGLPVNVYALPNPASYIIGLAPGGAEYPIFGQKYHAGTEIWFWMIRTSLGIAWVNQADVALVGDATDIPIVDDITAATFAVAPVSVTGIVQPPAVVPAPPAPTPPPPPVIVPSVSENFAQQTGPVISVAGAPSTTVITTSTQEVVNGVTVSVDTQITVSSSGQVISASTGIGGASGGQASQSTVSSAGSPRWIAQTVVPNAPLRRAPTPDGQAFAFLAQGTEAFINRRSDDGSHYLLHVPGLEAGWVAAESLRFRPPGVNYTVVIVTSDYVELRASPNSGSAVQRVLGRGHEATVLNVANGWFLVNAHPVEGWLPAEAVRVRTESISDLAVHGPNALPEAAQ